MSAITANAQARGRMWILFVAGAVLSWGAYGVLLHKGQVLLGNPLKALLCVGVAYFLIGVLVPSATLSAQGGLSNFNSTGLVTARSRARSAPPAPRASSIRSERRAAALRLPLVFGGAPIVNVLVSMAIHPPKSAIKPCCSWGSSSRPPGRRWSLFQAAILKCRHDHTHQVPTPNSSQSAQVSRLGIGHCCYGMFKFWRSA